MSANDGVYLIKFRSMVAGIEHCYRIAHLYAVENIYRHPVHLYNAFCDSDVYQDYKDAYKKAHDIDKEEKSEFGVMIINQYSEKTWSDLVDETRVLAAN